MIILDNKNLDCRLDIANIVIKGILDNDVKTILQAINNNNLTEDIESILNKIDLSKEFELIIDNKVKLKATIAHYAALKSKLMTQHIIEKLGQSPLKPTSEGTNLIHFAALSGKLDKLNFLLSNKPVGVDLSNHHSQSPIYFAALNSKEELLKFLLERKVNIFEGEKHGYTPLHYAACFDNAEAVKILVKYGARPNQGTVEGIVPLHLAARYDCPKAALALIENGADIKQGAHFGVNPLHFAARYNSIKVIKLLVEAGLDPNSGTQEEAHSFTPLHFAAFYNNKDAIQELIAHKANPNQGSTGGYTPLQIATVFANFAATQALIEHGADITQGNNEWGTPLLFAAGKGSQDFKKVEYLFINFKFAPKPIPKENAYKEIAEILLLQHKISLDHHDRSFQNAFDYAQKNKFALIANRLNITKYFYDKMGTRCDPTKVFQYLTSQEDANFLIGLIKSFSVKLGLETLDNYFSKLRINVASCPNEEKKSKAIEFNEMLAKVKSELETTLGIFPAQAVDDNDEPTNLVFADDYQLDPLGKVEEIT
ncbi:MAG: uncharacterized protein K0Q51_1062 [Rickettsiaceae bacterium]|jgi:ankyrin repeat protein|nr:uncharacterized protein [Rickettsiaceae bacterium]